MKRAIYAGSFDPITNGHLWMIQRGAELFDELIVAVGSNPDKSYTFDEATRLELLRQTTQGIPKLRIASFVNRFLIDYAREHHCTHLLRGIRSEADFSYEKSMRHINGDLCPAIDTIFLIPPREIAEISSSFVKGLIGPEGWKQIVKPYVPAPVYQVILKQFAHG